MENLQRLALRAWNRWGGSKRHRQTQDERREREKGLSVYLSEDKGDAAAFKVHISTINFSPSLRSQLPSNHVEKIRSQKTSRKKKWEEGRGKTHKKRIEKLRKTVMKLTVVLALRPDQKHRCAEQQRQPHIHKAEHV